MKNLITEEFKEKFKTAFARFMNETILNKEVRIAIDSEDKLIMMDRKTGSYTIYSDSIGRIIFRMYASKIASPVVTK